jgi:diguanylate cyclase (GGDEF)-like protein/PAS domain S-box-containing protein
MSPALRIRRRVELYKALPPEIYLPLVDSLFKDGRLFISASVFATVAICTTYWKTGEIILLYCATAFVLVTCARGILMREYFRARSTVTSMKIAKRWEHRYVAGATASTALLGFWCYAAFAWTSDPFAHLVSYCSTMGYAMGISGRNFGNIRFVIVQILCTAAPMTAALLLYGNPYYWVFAGILVPFFLAIKIIAERFQGTLLNALIASRDTSLLAKRFDTALNNMPHGLCMFDDQRHIVVTNQKLSQQMGLSPDLELKGSSLRSLVESVVAAGMISDLDVQGLIDRLDARLSGSDDTAFDVDMLNGRTLEFTVQPMENGGIVVLVEDITERKIAEAKINHLARFDALTGLANRSQLVEKLENALAVLPLRSGSVAVHFIDVDRFKKVNDTLGHDGGDFLLKMVAERLCSVTRGDDVVARLGGDEFVVVQTGVRDKDQAEDFARRLTSAVTAPMKLREQTLVATVSVGVALAPADGTNPELLLKSADLALYKAKASGRNCIRFFLSQMAIELQARFKLERMIRDAVLHGRFELHYQPFFEVSKRRLVGFEALIRLPTEDGTLIPPLEFIPVAEDLQLIDRIGAWVLREACRTAATWPEDLTVAVNLSPSQFVTGSISDIVAAALKEADLAANRLELEITETLMLDNSEAIMAELQTLKAMDVAIVMDDFGTGYSSLSYLWRFPFDKIKIDRSFMQNFDGSGPDATVVKTIIALGRELNMRVTVEGVETAAQAAFLDMVGGDQAQGWYFGRPVPASQVGTNILANFQKTHPVTSSPSAPEHKLRLIKSSAEL